MLLSDILKKCIISVHMIIIYKEKILKSNDFLKVYYKEEAFFNYLIFWSAFYDRYKNFICSPEPRIFVA